MPEPNEVAEAEEAAKALARLLKRKGKKTPGA